MSKLDESHGSGDMEIKVGNGDISNISAMPNGTARSPSKKRRLSTFPEALSSSSYMKFNACQMEKYSRVLFPMSFAIFSIVYWTYYFF